MYPYASGWIVLCKYTYVFVQTGYGHRKKSNILLAYQQGQIFEKFKASENFIDMIKKLGISKSILFKISIVNFVNKYPRMKKSLKNSKRVKIL